MSISNKMKDGEWNIQGGHLYAIQRGRVRAAKRLSSFGDTPYSPWCQRKITTKTTSSRISTSGIVLVLTAHLPYPIF